MSLMEQLAKIIKEYLADIGQAGGKIGGKSKSKAKKKASQLNAAKARAARVPKYPKCKGGYTNKSHRFGPDGRCYSEKCREAYPGLRRID
jgi:hypothetical protein